jgi:hypothetical protein
MICHYLISGDIRKGNESAGWKGNQGMQLQTVEMWIEAIYERHLGSVVYCTGQRLWGNIMVFLALNDVYLCLCRCSFQVVV